MGENYVFGFAGQKSIVCARLQAQRSQRHVAV
jgi:hypothetical protein